MSTDRAGQPGEAQAAASNGTRMTLARPGRTRSVQLLRRAHLSDDAAMLHRRRIIVSSLIDAAAAGDLRRGRRALRRDRRCRSCWTWKFTSSSAGGALVDRAELVVHTRMRTMAKTFRDRHLIPKGYGRLQAAMSSASGFATRCSRGAADCARLRRRHHVHLAPLHRARRSHVYGHRRPRRGSRSRGVVRYVTCDFPVPADPLVLPAVHLRGCSAGVADRAEPGPHAPGPGGGLGFLSRRHMRTYHWLMATRRRWMCRGPLSRPTTTRLGRGEPAHIPIPLPPHLGLSHAPRAATLLQTSPAVLHPLVVTCRHAHSQSVIGPKILAQKETVALRLEGPGIVIVSGWSPHRGTRSGSSPGTPAGCGCFEIVDRPRPEQSPLNVLSTMVLPFRPRGPAACGRQAGTAEASQ